MNKLITALFLVIIINISNSQIVINELDCDSPGIDNKEFIEIKSDVPNYDLDGYIIVMFNGSNSGGNRSYFTIDLQGYSTDLNGLLLIGSKTLSPVPQLLISENVIQNGADAICIYKSNINNFPEGTLATTNDLINALVYGTNDPDATSLMELLNISIQIDEGKNGKKKTESIQLNNDGTYKVASPTPRAHNDGSGIVLNGLSISTSNLEFIEGEEFEIKFKTEQVVTEDLAIEFTLNNNNFNSSDFSATLSLIISANSNSVKTKISLIDDDLDEGDEVLIIKLKELPNTFLKLNDNLDIRIVDNDFKVAPWGTPTNPTYGKVVNTMSVDYYSSLNGFKDSDLKDNIQDIIANPSLVKAQTYTEVIDILKEADQSPLNSNKVWLVYSEKDRPKLDFQISSDNFEKWNREHTFPRSRGGYFSIKEDEEINGIDTFWITSADSLRHGNSDAHALRAADARENSSRGKQHYGEYRGPFGNKGSFKGDVARSVLYMDVRYNDLKVVKGYSDIKGELGDLDTLLKWHRNDPPDDFELNRNNIVFKWQNNRNPFIDNPELVEYIWGDKKGQIWNKSNAVNKISILNSINVYPNPTRKSINFKGINEDTKIELFNMSGIKVIEFKIDKDCNLKHTFNRGTYLIRFATKENSFIKKLIVE